MAKKKKIKETTIEDFYDLKIDKVDELVAVLKGEEVEGEAPSMDISDCTGVDDPSNTTKRGKRKQFDPYRTDFLRNVPIAVKALFVKWWFAGAVCFFVNMGLGNYISDNLDMLVLTGIVMGVVVDMFVNPLLHFMESDEREYDKYMMFPFPFKAFWTFFTNIIYFLAVMICVNYIYFGINLLFTVGDSTGFWMEPLLFGVFTVIVDMAFVGIKDGIVLLVKKCRRKEKANV